MEILIRKEPNGSIYLDKTSAIYFDVLNMSAPPYNYTKKTIDDQYSDCEPTDFNNDLTFSVEKYNARKNAEKLDGLRTRREAECFTFINRGKLWYDKLTETQLNELNTWYHEWLDVTETLVIPTKPDWLE